MIHSVTLSIKFHKKTAGIFVNTLMVLTGLLVSSCNNQEQQTANRVVVSRTVTLVGLPAPENDVIELRKKATNKSIDLTGIWHGDVRLLISGKLVNRPIELNVKKEGASLVLEYKGLSEQILHVENLNYTPPVLSFEAPSYMSNADGDPMPFLAELIVMPTEIKGVYRQASDEVAGKILYHEYDANFAKVD